MCVLSPSVVDGMSGVGQLLLENERTKQKLRKVQQRRDFYAKQYFQTLQQLDHVRAELARAMNTIKELRGRGKRMCVCMCMCDERCVGIHEALNLSH